MAKRITIGFPYVVRELETKVARLLGLNLGIPMNAECPEAPNFGADPVEGKAALHFPGMHFNMRVEVGNSGYGQWVNINKLAVKISCTYGERAKWIGKVEEVLGPISIWLPGTTGEQRDWDPGKVSLIVEGEALTRLMAATSR